MFEGKWEIDSLASFMGLSYQYWATSGDDSFVNNSVWVDAVEQIISTISFEQNPTFNITSGNNTLTFFIGIYRVDLMNIIL